MWERLGRVEKRDQQGQGLLELALVLPALLILLLGLIELALMMRAQLILTNANREAARFASYGIYEDWEVAERAMIAFAGQLPARITEPEPNTGIIITRFHVPTGGSEDGAGFEPVYVTGTFTCISPRGNVKIATEEIAPVDPGAYLQDLEDQNAGFETANDVVVVETYYCHNQVLHAPIVQYFFPEPIVLYDRTVMRIGLSGVY